MHECMDEPEDTVIAKVCSVIRVVRWSGWFICLSGW